VRKPELYLGLDQGSSATKAVLINNRQEVVWDSRILVSRKIAANKQITQDPKELLHSVKELIEQAKEFSKEEGRKLAAIGFSFQRSGVCAWNKKSGKIIYPLLSWMDTSTRSLLENLISQRQTVLDKTSLRIVPHYAGGKISVLQGLFPDSDILVATLDTFILHQLSNDSIFVTEDSMAARSMLYDLDESKWDKDLCNIFGVEMERLPPISHSIGTIAVIGNIPVKASIGDQQAALLAMAEENSKAALMLGTVSSICVSTGQKIIKKPGFVSSVLYSKQATPKAEKECEYLLEGVTNSSGAVIEFILSRGTKLSEIDSFCSLAKQRDGDQGPVAFVPLAGTATPGWEYDLPSIISAPKVEKDQFTRACVESIGGFVSENILALQADGIIKDERIKVTGGLSKFSYLLQYISDCTGATLFCLELPEESARGAAIAAMGAQYVSAPIASRGTTITPEKNDISTRRFERWRELKGQSLAGVPFEKWQILL